MTTIFRMIPHSLRVAICSTAFVFTLATARAETDYPLTEDSKPHADVPKGELLKFTFDHAKIFPGTTREVTVYVPAQYDPAKPACVYVCQDGVQNNAPVVFDNLIAKKEMPVTVGVFITPGRVKALTANTLDRFNRSREYDGLGPDYARFVLDEVLPAVETKTTGDGRVIRLSKSGNDRCIGGSSSGAICAFTAAWERPDAFTRVFSSIGTFVGLQGGNVYPTLIRKFEPKPIRVFQQDGSNDNNIYGGDWWMANQEMERALTFAGYEHEHIWGDGGHNGKQAAAVFPDAMRFLWKGWPEPVKAGTGKNAMLNEIVIPGEGWQLVAEGFKFTEGPACNAKGEVFFTDIPNNRIHRIGLDGKVSVFVENSGAANGLMFGPDGKLYACQNGKRRIVAYDESGKETVIAEDIGSNDLCVAHNGSVYVTDPDAKKVLLISNGAKRVVDEGIAFANGVRLTPDQSLLVVANTKGQFVYSFQVQADGTLAFKQPYFDLHIPDGKTDSGADGMTFDTQGRLYVTTHMGVQVCDQAGRVNCILPKPQEKWLANVVFGGANFNALFVTSSDKIYRRKTKAKGVLSANEPVKPPAPHL